MMPRDATQFAFALCCAALLHACGSEPAAPEGVLSRDAFKELLLQAHLIEAEAGYIQVFDTADRSGIMQRYDSLFVRSGTDRAAFERTFEHYSQRPEEFRAINEEILSELGERKDTAH